jgi:hypothetical protein
LGTKIWVPKVPVPTARNVPVQKSFAHQTQAQQTTMEHLFGSENINLPCGLPEKKKDKIYLINQTGEN